MSQPSPVWKPFAIDAGCVTDYKMKLWDANNEPAAIAADDVLRFKLKLTRDSPPLLEIRSGAALPGGSTITIVAHGVAGETNAEIIVRFSRAETVALDWKKEHWGDLGLVDRSETAPPDAFKRIAHGPVCVNEAPGGEVGATP